MAESKERIDCGNDVECVNTELLRGGIKVGKLTKKQFRVFEVLASRRGPVAHESLYAALYENSEDPPADDVIRVFVCQLRKRLTAAGAGVTIGTVRQFGYVLERKPQQAAT